MTNFEFYCQKCQQTKYFYCQIVLKDYTLVIIENDLQKLLAINGDEVFYFLACWQTFDLDENGNIEYFPWFKEITSDDDFTEKAYYLSEITSPWFYAEFDFGINFGISILYVLFYRGIDVQIIESFIPQLFESYKKQMDRWLKKQAEAWYKETPDKGEEWAADIRKELSSEWENKIMGWKQMCDLELSLSSKDKALYDQVADLIIDFDFMILDESASYGENQWCMIVWNTIKIVRNGGGTDEVKAHLGGGGWANLDTAEKKHRVEVAKKIVKFIRGDVNNGN